MVSSCLLALLSQFVYSANSLAQNDPIRFDIPSQNIQSALDAFVEATNFSLIYNKEDFSDVVTATVSGQYTPGQALGIMLQGTGLTFEFTSRDTVAVIKSKQQTTERKEESKESLPSPDGQNKVKTSEGAFILDGAFMLEEITVTAEKREANLQKLASSVVALPGDDLARQSRITTQQIIESVSNVTFRNGGGQNPDGNIAIRGIQRTQVSGGVDDILPSTTAVYVDGVYQGIGGHYDINRVEVLRGPQGTLYGRSATGGVIAFYTNDPKLNEFSGNVSAEYGNYSLVNAEGVVNVPAGDKVALRAAAHYYSRDGYFDKKGGRTETREGRLKILFQPTDPFQIVLSGSTQATQDWGGGWTMTLAGPDTIDYHQAHTEPSKYPLKTYNQIGVNTNYNFGNSTLTWIGGYHDYDYNGLGPESIREGSGARQDNSFPTDWFHTEEVRLASDTDGPLTWLVGANYFKHEFNSHLGGYQTFAPGVPDDNGLAPRYVQHTNGNFLNYGFFTEETFKLRDNFRITAGLRYDYTKLTLSQTFMENTNYAAPFSHFVLNPPIWAVGTLNNDIHKWHNVTYKLRFEYDVTPGNLLYLTTATGFLPGYAAVNPQVVGGEVTSWVIRVLDEQKLTSYELGAKNQFLDDRLRVNASVFYYDLEGYPEAYNLTEMSGPNFLTIMSTPIEVIGAELETEYLLTMNDRISLNLGYQRPKITGWPDAITWRLGEVTPGRDAAMLDIQPGHPQFDGTLDYDHIFSLSNGSTLVPRVELHYTSAYYLSQINYLMIDLGEKPYDHQGQVALCNANVIWTAPNKNYSVNAWVRNAFGEEYKTGVMLVPSEPLSDMGVSVGDPRTFGVTLSAKF